VAGGFDAPPCSFYQINPFALRAIFASAMSVFSSRISFSSLSNFLLISAGSCLPRAQEILQALWDIPELRGTGGLPVLRESPPAPQRRPLSLLGIRKSCSPGHPERWRSSPPFADALRPQHHCAFVHPALHCPLQQPTAGSVLSGHVRQKGIDPQPSSKTGQTCRPIGEEKSQAAL